MHRYSIVGEKLHSLFTIVALALLLAIVLAACGSNGGIRTSTGSISNSTPTPTFTPIQGYGSANGCPSDAVVTTAPSVANVTINLADAHSPVIARVGDVIEIQLPFGLRWTGSPASAGELHELQLQIPAGYASMATKMCIWRYSAQSAGMAHLTFLGRVICKKDLPCPLAVRAVIFTIEVK